MLGLGSSLSTGGGPLEASVPQVLKSLSFDGTNDFVELSSSPLASGTQDFSISLWHKSTDNNLAQAFIGRNSATGNANYLILGVWADQYFATIKTAAGLVQTGTGSNPGTATITYGSWRHVVLVLKNDGTNMDLTLYAPQHNSSNPIFNDTTSSTGATQNALFLDSNSMGPWLFGTELDGGPTKTDFLKGNIAEIGFFNAALDMDDANAIYNSGTPLNLKFNSGGYDKANNLQSYYRFDSDSLSSNVAKDEVGSSNGTVNGPVVANYVV